MLIKHDHYFVTLIFILRKSTLETADAVLHFAEHCNELGTLPFIVIVLIIVLIISVASARGRTWFPAFSG